MRKKSHRDGPRKEDYPWFRVGWTAECVSSTGEAMSVSWFLISTRRGVGGFLCEPGHACLLYIYICMYIYIYMGACAE